MYLWAWVKIWDHYVKKKKSVCVILDKEILFLKDSDTHMRASLNFWEADFGQWKIYKGQCHIVETREAILPQLSLFGILNHVP